MDSKRIAFIDEQVIQSDSQDKYEKILKNIEEKVSVKKSFYTSRSFSVESSWSVTHGLFWDLKIPIMMERISLNYHK